MRCYTCGGVVEPHCYPEGKCDGCGLTYTLEDSEWDWSECVTCGEEFTTGAFTEERGECIDCIIG